MNQAGTHRDDPPSAHLSAQEGGGGENPSSGRSRRPARLRPHRGVITTEGPLTVNSIIDDFRKNRLDASQAWLRKLERQAANQPEASELLRIAEEAAHAFDQVLADLEKLRALLKKPAPKKYR